MKIITLILLVLSSSANAAGNKYADPLAAPIPMEDVNSKKLALNTAARFGFNPDKDEGCGFATNLGLSAVDFDEYNECISFVAKKENRKSK